MNSNIDEVLRRAISAGASDVHLKVGSGPIVRIDGELRRLDGYETLRPADTQAYAADIFTPKAAADFKERGAADFAYGKHELGRFRTAAFRQRGSVALVMSRVMARPKSFAELGLPRIVEKVANTNSGLVLITGPFGSGKSTTVASIVDWINSNRGVTILTVEDPIEVLHPDKRSVVVQREVGVDTASYVQAVKGATRHDTEVIMLSEIADYETAKAAVHAAESGHLVISSMRTSDPAETIGRLVAMFPETERPVIRSQLAHQMQAIVSQVLIDCPQGGFVLACEVLINNEPVQEWILAGHDSAIAVDILKEGGFHGMQTFDQALLKHVVENKVTIESVLPHARNTHEIRAQAQTAGISV